MSGDSQCDDDDIAAAQLARIRHDLYGPINAIIGYTEMLLDDVPDQAGSDLKLTLNTILGEGKSALTLVAQFLCQGIRCTQDANGLTMALRCLQDSLCVPSKNIKQQCQHLLGIPEYRERPSLGADLASISLSAKKLDKLLAAFIDESKNTQQGSRSLPFGTSEDLADLPRASSFAVVVAREREHLSGKILVVDDNEVNRDILSRLLTREGHRVSLAEDGQVALGLLAQEAFDLVLLDILMPVMDGFQTLCAIKADPALWHLPIIVISNSNEIENVVRCIEMGAEDYLSKVFNPILLQARIDVCLEKKRMRDKELLYLKHVEQLTHVAEQVQTGSYKPTWLLNSVAKRRDGLGSLARVFRRMIGEIYAREKRLKEKLHTLQIEIDRSRASRQVAEITQTKYFQDLKKNAKRMRSAHRRGQGAKGNAGTLP